MTHTAQQAYDAHVAQQKANWSTMTTDQQDASLRTEKTLQLAAELEAINNDIEAQAQAQSERQAHNAVVVADMKTKGYSGNGTLEDFKKLFKPSVFGPTCEQKAIAAFNAGEDFIELYEEYGKL